MAGDKDKKVHEREKLKNLIAQWNANRLDIFWLTEPNEELEFHGAMRFYFQDAGQKVATKCIRVSSTAAVADVIKTLIEKFRPDIRMLSIPEYAIYEIHENGEERKLGDNEKPLFVQLDWHKDDREGRFLLRRMDEKSYITSMDAYDNDNFKRKLSKREKKEKKKREKKERQKAAEEEKKNGIAEHLYSELPETSFTRSISNPEAVMRRRRQQKLEQRLQQFCQEGGTGAGGTLRIFGESLNKDVPYKTLLLSMKDTATYVVKEILEKYGHEQEDPTQYCLVQVIIPHPSPSDGNIHEFQNNGGIREYILDDDDCPLLIEHQHHRSRGTLTFHVRRRPADYQPRKRKKKPKPSKSESDANYRQEDSLEKLPYLLELNPDGSEAQGAPKKHRLFLNVTEVGSERSSSTRQYLQLFGPNVQPRHCVIAHTEGIVTVTPSSREAETYVNNLRIYETTILQPGMVVRFGKLHTFRFVDPLHIQKNKMLPDPRQSVEFLDRSSRREDQLSLHQHGSYETTFDADGNIETVSTHSRDDRMSKKSDDAHSHRSLGRESSQGRGSYDKFESKRGNDPILPAILELWEEGEDAVLSAVVTNLDRNHVQFKLSPTYILYMAARFRASTHFRPKSSPSDRAHRLTAFMNKIASLIHQVIQDRYRDAASLAFWLANSSELLHFLKQDRHLSAYTLDAQDLLAESVQLAFHSLVTCQQSKLQTAMIAFLEDRDDMTEKEGTTAEVLSVLSSMMNLLRCCRVNAALTIQLLTQSFHDINMWLFNKLVCEMKTNLCTRLWGVRLKRRLSRIENWAQEQGLELASDCHLSQIVQAAHLLQAPKSNPEDLTAISSFCFKLNSIQLKTILEKYQNVPEEPPIPRELIDSVVKVAENTADQQVRSEGREVKLEEDTDLQFPFLPEDGYSCDIIRDVPMGLKEFLEPLIQTGFCRLAIQPTSCGFWTIYMSDQDVGRVPSRAHSPSIQSNPNNDTESASGWSQKLPEPEVTTICVQKSNNGIGLSIVAAGGVDQDKLGIYVKSVVKGGAADLDGRLQAGDQLLKVDGQSLVGVNQEKAAELMTRTGLVVTLEVAKQGAIYNGLADLLSKPSPIIQRGPRRMSERDIPSRVMNEHVQDGRLQPGPGHPMQPRMQSSKSVPSLNSGHHQEPIQPPAIANLRSQEMSNNPAYSRTSSTASIPKGSDFIEKARSANNLRQDPAVVDPKHPYHESPGSDANPPPYPGPPLANVNGRPISQPNLHKPLPPQPGHGPTLQPQPGHGPTLPPQPGHGPTLPPHQPTIPPAHPAANLSEERHYQNISMYQQTPPHYHPQQQQQHQNVYPHTRSPSQPCPPPNRGLHGSQSSLNRPDHQMPNANDRSRPLSTLVSPREQEQYVNSMGYAHSPGSGPPPSPKGLIPSGMDPRHVHHPPYSQRPLPDHRDFRSAEQLRHNENEHMIRSHSMQQHPQYIQDPNQLVDPRQRDLIRQEAKMEEMREEVRRREERDRMMLQQQQQQQQQMHQAGRGHPAYHPRGPNPNVRPQLAYNHVPPHIPNHQGYVGGPPPPAPKPRPMLHNNNSNAERFQRPRYENPGVDGSPMYQDIMHPPGPHQNNMRHPNPPPPVVSYRYGPSGYPPRPAMNNAGMRQPMTQDPRIAALQGRAPPPHGQNSRVSFELSQSPNSGDRKESNLTSPSPWEREEKEKLHKQRLEEARRARDAEIRELEGTAYMSSKQEERLKTLRLEQEFQRRAEELRGEDDDEEDDELLDRAESRERMLKVQEDLERSRQRRLEWEQEQIQPQHPPKLQHLIPQPSQEEWRRQHNQLEGQEEKLRQLRLEEVNRRRELEANRTAEEHLLREARRRQDEFKGPHMAHPPLPARPSHLPSHQHIPPGAIPQGMMMSNPNHVRHNIENSDNPDVPPPLPTSPPPVEHDYPPNFNMNHSPMYKGSSNANHPPTPVKNQNDHNHYPQQNSLHRLPNDKVVEPPAPPMRKSSYEVTSQMGSPGSGSGRHMQPSIKNGEGNTVQTHHTKKVSFHDPSVQEVGEYDTNGNFEQISDPSYTLDDIDEVLATPHNTQNLNTYNPGKTPGVIGAQEVYRDPRQRIEAERHQHETYTGRNPGPEKLTFKEKMKMFAQEVGEPETPKDKVKISRAQRDIETNLNGN